MEKNLDLNASIEAVNHPLSVKNNNVWKAIIIKTKKLPCQNLR
jgi:hypothetical protein